MPEDQIIDPPATTTVITPTTATVTDTTSAPATTAPTTEPNWRERIAGGDQDILKVAARYNSEVDFAKAHLELRKKLDSGEYKKNIPFPEKGTPEQIAEWRKETGIPETPDKYDLSDLGGLVIGDAEKPAVNAFLEKVHGKNLPPEAVKVAVASYFEMQAEAQAQAVEADRAFSQQQEEALRTKWGSDYLPNKNLAENFAVTRFGDEIGKAIMSAGPEAVEQLAAIAREINPAMTLVPNSADPGKAISDELATLKSQMGTPEWMRDPSKQQRYLQLMDGQSAMRR